ncbi:MAG: glycosyltransferase family 4 protein [Tildeniella torsiva UHER 1998/13D]|jgi:glycosyltransferase involved in cell wall biosynthesis|nr:glycosyltransferase family 4 protein [Tildeniella torsiva UHER 1998/13D]
MKKIAILLHTNSFEDFFKRELGIDEPYYLNDYRHDWSWYFCDGLKQFGSEPILYVFSGNYSFYGLHETRDGFKVRFLPLENWYISIGRKASNQIVYWQYKYGFKFFSPLVKYFSELLNALAGIKYLKYYLEEDRIDVLYIQEYWTTRFDFLVGRLKLPVIGADQGGKATNSIFSLKRKSFPKAYKLTCQTPEELEQVKRYGADAIYFPNPVDTDFFSPAEVQDKSNEQKTLLIVARLNDKQKRISDLIRALLYLDDEWSLDIMGIGADAQTLKDLVSELKLLDRVNFIGFVTEADVKRGKYRSCSVYVMPSASEGLPFAALEAMSCGAPIVSSDIDAFKRIVQNNVNGVRVPLGDPESIANAVLKCYENRHEYGLESRNIILKCHSNKVYFSTLSKMLEEASRHSAGHR